MAAEAPEAKTDPVVSNTANLQGPSKADNPAINPNRKRKVALSVAYLGAGYAGMQYNPGQKTIEGDLMEAISKAGGISTENAGHFTKVAWARAARTDKGVNAVGQVVSLKMVLLPSIIDRINAQLPPHIRALGYNRVINGFDARILCDKRQYEYILPVWAFDPSLCLPASAHQNGHAGTACAIRSGTWSQPVPASPDTAIPPATTEALPAQHLSNAASAPPTLHPNGAVPAHAQQQADGKAHGDALSVPEAASQQPDEAAGSLPPAAASARPPEAASSAQPASHAAVHEASTAPALQSAAATPEASAAPALQLPAAVPEASLSFDSARQEQLNGILEQYTGTHNFHNFTSRVAGNDPSAKRYISSFQCEGTIKLQGQEWVRMVVVGQSFMLHQIRKMVGLAVAMMRGVAGPYIMPAALSPSNEVKVPLAPEKGLFLERCIFDAYNARWSSEHGEGVDLAQYQEQIAAFKADILYPHIAQDAGFQEQLQLWLRSLNEGNHNFQHWKDTPVTHHSGKHSGAKRKIALVGPKGAQLNDRVAKNMSEEVETGASPPAKLAKLDTGADVCSNTFSNASLQAEWSD